MSDPTIVPIHLPQSRRFEKRRKNEQTFRLRQGKLELFFYQSSSLDEIKTVLELVMNDGTSSQ